MADAYRVTAPYVTLKVKDPAGADVLIGFYEGAVVTDVDPESLEHHLDGEMLEKVSAAEAKQAAGLGSEPKPAKAPAKSDKD